MPKATLSHKQFKDTAPAYRGVALWMLNDKLVKEELHDQLEKFKQGGWGAVIARTFPGLLTEYLSDEWMELMSSLVTTKPNRNKDVVMIDRI